MATSEIHLHLDSDCDDVFSLSSDCDLSPLDYPRNRRNSCFAIVPNVENLQTVKTTHRGRTWSKGFASDRRCHDVCEESKRLSCSQSTRANPTLHDAKPKMPHFPYEVLGTRKSCPDPGIRRRLATDVTVAGGKRTLEESTVPSSAHAFGDFEDAGCATGKPVDGNSKFRLFYSAATPILRGIANVLGNARGGSGVTSGTSTSPMDPNEQARRIAAVVGEPPDFSELQNPGPVFGAPLENQISSADFPNVPLILHAMVTALELNGLHHVGLYRVPGKQKEVSRFVCLANMTSLDPDVLLHLDAWKDARVLTSAIKLFFRRLPEPILDQASWEPLASIVPEMSSEWTTASLAYALLAILVKLSKLQTRAITMQTPLNIVPSTRNVDYNKGLDLWRLATLDFLFDHLRRLEALAVTNQCSFACIAVCFGPSLFGGDSTIQPKLNMVLEVMLQHWPWLKTSLFNTGGGGASQDAVATARVGRVLPDALGSLRAIKPPTLAQTEAYVEQFFARGTDLGQSSDSLPTSFMAADTNGDTSKYPSNDVVSAVKEIFTRAGLISENVATISPGSSCRPDTKGDSTAHTVLKSVPPGNREADCGIQTPRASVSFRNGSVKDGRVCGQDEKIRKVPTFRKTNF
uniref:Rho-GAP domain-containing protein n=2 Tax=Mesocestoides corti TaxID=53468 RepID=A0A5K3FKF4_MESCO